MYQPLRVAVTSLGEDVELVIGSWSRRMFFEVAILLAAWMDDCARAAKAWAGREDRKLYAIGTLHDASDPHWLNAGQPFDPNRVYPVNRDLLAKQDIAVRHAGATVVLKAGMAEAAMPYEAAFRISHWLRVRAKESQMRAGDLDRHWSKVKQAHEAEKGPGVTRG